MERCLGVFVSQPNKNYNCLDCVEFFGEERRNLQIKSGVIIITVYIFLLNSLLWCKFYVQLSLTEGTILYFYLDAKF